MFKSLGPWLFITYCYTAAKLLQLCPTLCYPIDGRPPGSPVPGILQARTLEWVAISFSKCMKVKSESEVAQSHLTLSNPRDCSLPGSSVHVIFQARVLERVAIAFSENLHRSAFFFLSALLSLQEVKELFKRKKSSKNHELRPD